MNVWILSATGTYLPAIERMVRSTGVAGLIGLRPGLPEDVVSGYCDYSAWCGERGLRHVEIAGYGLGDAEDRRKLEALDIDVLLVLGWQRLLPAWLIAHCRGTVIGVHGSSLGITAGRGRSPLNWALMLRQSPFVVSLFHIRPGIDDGPVIASRTFPLSPFDDIRTAYWKMALSVGGMLVAAFRDGRLADAQAVPQEGPAYYLPQRLPADGMIDWRRGMDDVCAFVRALTRPYPGAFTTLDGQAIRIWRARPLMLGDAPPDWPIGTVADATPEGSFLVRCGDGLVQVDEHDAVLAPGPGAALGSADWRTQMTDIIDRHQRRYPDMPVSPALLAARDHGIADCQPTGINRSEECGGEPR